MCPMCHGRVEYLSKFQMNDLYHEMIDCLDPTCNFKGTIVYEVQFLRYEDRNGNPIIRKEA